MNIQIDDIKIAVSKTLQKYGVKKAALFGSIVRNEMTEESDIDILVEFEGSTSLFKLSGLKLELEEILGKTVDVITYDSLNPRLKNRILHEQKVIK
jgi:predicted nucleotidyltransferase